MCIMNNESHHTMNVVETSSWNNNYELLKLQCRSDTLNLRETLKLLTKTRKQN